MSCICQLIILLSYYTMSNTTNCNAIDAIRPDLEAFTSLWTALRITYGGTNITKTVARLLHMYQPQDGIQAYERLLKTLFVLLEDFDGNGLRLLVSMVPPPKGSSDEMIKEVFFQATGFVRIDAPIFHQNYPLLSSMTNPIVDETKKRTEDGNILDQSARETHSNMKNINTAKDPSYSESSQILSQDYSFRGFPSTEVQHQNKNLPRYDSGQYFIPECHNDRAPNLPLNNYKVNWPQNPCYFQNGHVRPWNSFYRDMLVRTMDNKYLRIPVAHFNPNLHYFNRPCQMVPIDRNVQSNHEHTITSGLLNSPSVNVEESRENHMTQQKNKSSDEKSGIKSYPDLNEHNYNLPKRNEINPKHADFEKKYDTIRNEIYKMDEVKSENNVPISIEDCILENLTVGTNLAESIKNFLNRAEKDESSDSTGDVIETAENINAKIEVTNADEIRNLQSQSQQTTRNKSCEIKREMNDYQNATNDGFYNQSCSISELAAYKRQYYDALLNVQRAKMAVANSLILAPTQSRNDYEPYHPDNLQHHWIFQPSQRLMVGSSYPQRFVQPEYSVIPNACNRSNDWMPMYHPTRVAQENPSMHAACDSRLIYSNQDSASHINDCIPVETKLEAKKRKLENIVVKLKENEMNSVHN